MQKMYTKMVLEDSECNHMYKEKFNHRRVIVGMLSVPLFCTLFMFLPAGTIHWLKGWLFIIIFSAVEVTMAFYLWRTNPELLIARSHFHKGTKRWDKILLSFLFPTLIAIFVIAALDGGRFHWSSVPWWVCGLGYVLFFIGFGIASWAGKVNKFAEVTVRIQKDRGHRVIESGPYGIVRHPVYTGAIPMFLGIALALGSLWALIPSFVAIVLLLIRTQLEDRALQKELHGYKEYTYRVRYKLFPHVW